VRNAYARARPVRNRYLVRERDRRRLHELMRLGLAVLLVGSALVGYTWLHQQLLGSGYRLEAMRQELRELERLERHLRLEESYLASPPRVETRAVAELGMRPPELSQLLFVELVQR
jgi:cell division protein FtsL